ncbi:MAG TPA: hypothetical protein PK468_16140, partial [Candidatus Hydrogenedentes bacterium]|nr:hypothetical protein [Candidatus Hydrogenedentota bacterium]
MGSSAAYRHCLILMLASTYCLLAHPAPFTWTGAVNNDWGQAANWSPAGPPGLSDSAVIPATPTGGRFPTLQPGESFCSGLILEANAEIVVASGAGLYVIGEGDMDGDGLADVAEIILGSMDVDLDGDPNLNDPDSDGDGMDDGWEDLYGFDPYAVGDPGDPGHPHADPDGDGRDNLKEFQDGTDPWTYDCAMPAAAAWALLVTAGAVLGLAGIGMRKRGRWASASALLVFGLVTGGTVFADDTPAAGSPKANVSVDFAAGDSIPAAAATANAGDRLLLSGSFVRPWNGRSTYATKALTLKAVGGPVFLGGMRTDLAVGVSGEGTVEVTSAYTATLHPAPVDNVVDYGTQPVFCFLGERLQLAPTPAEDWAFFAWTGDVQGNTDPLTMQVAEDGLAVTSVFAP